MVYPFHISAALVLVCILGGPATTQDAHELLDDINATMDDPLYRGPSPYRRMDQLTKEELLSASRHANPSIRGIACLHLAEKHASDLTAADIDLIRSLLDDDDFKIPRHAAGVLARNKRYGVPILAECLHSPPSMKASCAAAALLESGQTDDDLKARALSVVLDAVGRDHPISSASEAYLRNHPDSPARDPLRRKALDATTSDRVRAAAISILASHAKLEDPKLFLRFLDSKSEAVRFACLEGLRYHPSETVIREIAKLRNDPNENIRRWCYLCMQESKLPLAMPFLLEGLQDKSYFVVHESLQGIAQLGDDSMLPALAAYLESAVTSQSAINQYHTRAAQTMTKLLRKDKEFTFEMIGGHCGTPMFMASAKIQKGEKIGGEEGRRMAEEGRREVEAMRKGMEQHDTEARAHNRTEIVRLLEWWHTQGEHEWRTRHPAR